MGSIWEKSFKRVWVEMVDLLLVEKPPHQVIFWMRLHTSRMERERRRKGVLPNPITNMSRATITVMTMAEDQMLVSRKMRLQP